MDAETISINDDESILNNFKADINNLVIYGVCKKSQEKEKN